MDLRGTGRGPGAANGRGATPTLRTPQPQTPRTPWKAPAEMSGLSIDGRPLEDLRVVDLKEELDKRGLSKVGKKDVLYARLRDALADAPQPDADAPPKAQDPDPAPSEPLNPMVAEYLQMQQRAMAGKPDQPALETVPETAAEVANDTTPTKAASPSPPPAKEPSPVPQETESRLAGGTSPARPVEEAADEGAEAAEEEKAEVAAKSPEPSPAASPTQNGAEEEEPAMDLGVEVSEADAKPDEEPREEKEGSVESADGKEGKKRKWGTTSASKRGKVAISSDTLKDLGLGSTAEALSALPPVEEQLELDYDEAEPRDEPPPKEASKEPSPAPPAPKHQRIIVSHDSDGSRRVEREKPKRRDDPIKEITTTLEEEGITREKSPSPPRHPTSTVLQVRGLTRPFTLKQLHALLGGFGSFSKDNFWMDGIKSHCLVKFDSEEGAKAARDGLHNVRWPQGNPKVLRCDFATEERLTELQTEPAAAKRAPPAAPAPALPQRTVTTEGRDMVELTPVERRVSTRDSVDERPRERSGREVSTRDRSPEPRRRLAERERPVRAARESRSPERRRPAVRREASPEPPPKPAAPKTPPKTLEELFQKTKALPALYWKEVAESEMEAMAVRRAEEAERAKLRAKDRREGSDDEQGGFPPAPRYDEGRGYGASGSFAGGRSDPWSAQRAGYGGGGGGYRGGGYGGGGRY